MKTMVRRFIGLLGVVSTIGLFIASPAHAQISTVGPPVALPAFDSGGQRALDVARLPSRDAFLVVATHTVGDNRQNRRAQLLGVFTDAAGRPITASFPIDLVPAFAWSLSSVRVVYSPDLDGGNGGFLVAWWSITSLAGRIQTQVVAFPGRLVGPTNVIATSSWNSVRLDLAFSPLSRLFLLTWGPEPTFPFDVVFSYQPPRFVMLGSDARPLGPATLLGTRPAGCSEEFEETCNNVGVAWNPVSNDFGILHSDNVSGSESRQYFLTRVSPNGVVQTRTRLTRTIPQPPFAFAVNESTGNYLVVFEDFVGTVGIALDSVGHEISTGVIGPPAYSGYWLGLAYDPASGTFLFAESTARLFELNDNGWPLSVARSNKWLYTRAVPRGNAPGWFMVSLITVASSESPFGVLVPGVQIVTTATRNSRLDLRLTGCVTSDPFVALGGGTCRNGGWYPPGITPPSAIAPGGCSSPNPFGSDGICAGGVWSSLVASPLVSPIVPTITAPTTGCVTPDPFVALGGGTCANGGWYPPGISPPPVIVTPCATPDPFVAIGGGVCANGGWRPRGSF